MKYRDELEQTARALVAPAKGILAADESSGTIKRRFDAIGVEARSRTAATTASCSSALRARTSS
jgi:fructose-bisphosphate aldolase class 1